MVSLNPCCNGRGSKTSKTTNRPDGGLPVLILVVMEEGQRPEKLLKRCEKLHVLILVVMEEGQRHKVH